MCVSCLSMSSQTVSFAAPALAAGTATVLAAVRTRFTRPEPAPARAALGGVEDGGDGHEVGAAVPIPPSPGHGSSGPT